MNTEGKLKVILDLINITLLSGKNEIEFTKKELDTDSDMQSMIDKLESLEIVSKQYSITKRLDINNIRNGECPILFYINKEKFMKIYKPHNTEKIELEFNDKIITYGEEIYRPKEKILCLIKNSWEKRYRSGKNIQKGMELGQTIPTDCGIEDIGKAAKSFNHTMRRKKIPIRIKTDDKKYYLIEN